MKHNYDHNFLLDLPQHHFHLHQPVRIKQSNHKFHNINIYIEKTDEFAGHIIPDRRTVSLALPHCNRLFFPVLKSLQIIQKENHQQLNTKMTRTINFWCN